MPINWNAYEREENDIDEREAAGDLTREEAQAERRALNADVRAAREEDIANAIDRVNDEYGW